MKRPVSNFTADWEQYADYLEKQLAECKNILNMNYDEQAELQKQVEKQGKLIEAIKTVNNIAQAAEIIKQALKE
jgi:hypothetical protein